VRQTLQGARLETAADLCQNVLAAAQEFMKVPPTHNDVTTLALLRNR